jgi:hypothetical protein
MYVLSIPLHPASDPHRSETNVSVCLCTAQLFSYPHLNNSLKCLPYCSNSLEQNGMDGLKNESFSSLTVDSLLHK